MFPLSPSPINKAAECLEDSRKTMDFVEYHELIFVHRQIEFRVGQLCASEGSSRSRYRGRGVRLRLLSETQHESCFADLSWPKQQ